MEEWWDKGRYRIEVNDARGKEVQTSEPHSPHLSATRTSFLLRAVLDQTVNPMNEMTPELSFNSVNRTFGTLKVRCLSANWQRSTYALPQILYCTPPDSKEVMLTVNEPISVQIRNEIARFHEVNVALKTSRMLFGRLAVSGEVKALRDFDATKSEFPEFRPTAPGSDEQEVAPGYLISSPAPDVPVNVGQFPQTGLVYVIVGISPAGAVMSTEVIASTSPFISAAALRTIPTWKFGPWKRDGRPTNGQLTLFLNPSQR